MKVILVMVAVAGRLFAYNNLNFSLGTWAPLAVWQYQPDLSWTSFLPASAALLKTNQLFIWAHCNIIHQFGRNATKFAGGLKVSWLFSAWLFFSQPDHFVMKPQNYLLLVKVQSITWVRINSVSSTQRAPKGCAILQSFYLKLQEDLRRAFVSIYIELLIKC